MPQPVICTHPNAVPDAAHDGQPWKAHLRFKGPNPKNKGGYSFKFWEITGTGLGPVTVRFGKIGSKGRSQKVDYHTALERLYKKYNEGYEFAS